MLDTVCAAELFVCLSARMTSSTNRSRGRHTLYKRRLPLERPCWCESEASSTIGKGQQVKCDVGGVHFLSIEWPAGRNEGESVPSSWSRGGPSRAWRAMQAAGSSPPVSAMRACCPAPVAIAVALLSFIPSHLFLPCVCSCALRLSHSLTPPPPGA
jgi:hypothetical protein